MRPARVIIAILLGLAGVVWFLQGIGVLPGSVMSGSTFWAVAGVVVLAVAVVVLVAEFRRRPSSG
ncbi:MAG TPA: hypothetical protein VFL03_03075 [Candidatus Limnocylindrales bacterium]|jgi:hypothetical protein|nr:hypothetical protein [Candidatus Limnocylindrales bacterium]